MMLSDFARTLRCISVVRRVQVRLVASCGDGAELGGGEFKFVLLLVLQRLPSWR